MKTTNVLIEKKEYVVTLTLNRPEKRNSLSLNLLSNLVEIFEKLAKDSQVRTVIIRGAGDKAFSSGYDIKAIPTDLTTPQMQEKMITKGPLEKGIQSILNFPYPVIAMINGYAFGAGCELAACCDLRIAVEDAYMGMPPAKLGLVYPLNGLQRFVQLLGLSKTKELFFTGKYYPAIKAKQMGLVDYVCTESELETFTFKLAKEISHNAPLALKGTKRVLGILSESMQISNSDRKEADFIVAEAFNSDDLKEGQAAFIEKRKPNFKGY